MDGRCGGLTSHSLDVLDRLSVVVPAALVARAEAWSAHDIPVQARASASVVLLRELGGHLETYLLHRHARMLFAASMVVFPGGGVDPGDAAAGRDSVRVCAVRETQEETGVLLTDRDLHDWAHWMTPEIEPRRFDTRFFVAPLPAGQQARDLSGETDRVGWSSPRAALAQAERGKIALMPPTLSILMELSDVANLSGVLELAQDRCVGHVLPRLQRTEQGWEFSYLRFR